MKKIFVFTLILTALWTSSFSQSKKARISFKNEVHKFGTIKEEDGPYEVDFNFTNTGDEPLKLIKVKAG